MIAVAISPSGVLREVLGAQGDHAYAHCESQRQSHTYVSRDKSLMPNNLYCGIAPTGDY